MVSRFLQVTALFVLVYLILSCSDDDCPTCNDQVETLFVCGGGFSEAGVSGPNSELNVNAGFIGSPVPSVSSFQWLGYELERCDEGLPCFDKRLAGPYTKIMDIRMIVELDTVSFDLSLPDPFHLIEPPVETTEIPSGVPLELIWSTSADAEMYFFKVYVLFDHLGFTSVELETTFTSIDTTAVFPEYHLLAGREIVLMIAAGKGVGGEPGDQTNFSHGNLRGFLGTAYETKGITALIG